MRLRTFNASDMGHAMQMIRENMGLDAIIIASAKSPEGGIVVTAACEHELSPQPLHAPPQMHSLHTQEATLASLEAMLRFHAPSDETANKLLETARFISLQGKDIRTDLIRLMAACFQYAPLPLDQNSYTIMLVGSPGTGKTMTVAKMASQAVMDGQKPIVISTDNKRAGGVEQLSAFTTILGIPLHVADNRGELWRLLREYAPHNRILIDTGGVNPFQTQEVHELADFIKLDRSIEPVLVAAAGCDSGEADDMARTFAPLGVRRMLVTRIDAARRYGSVLTTAFSGKFAFTHASNSSRVVGEFTTIDPVILTELLLRYQTQPRSVV
jgi:flagellar biosynthesis protein FlhF